MVLRAEGEPAGSAPNRRRHEAPHEWSRDAALAIVGRKHSAREREGPHRPLAGSALHVKTKRLFRPPQRECHSSFSRVTAAFQRGRVSHTHWCSGEARPSRSLFHAGTLRKYRTAWNTRECSPPAG